jgi:16S rRNA (guanine(966)-N(2))-methyltransferase RsmD
MRIIAGEFRSRALEAPAGLATRPTSDRLRETLFNVLAPRIEGAAFLDLYAGSGAVGMEALSRRAAAVDFVERAPAALKILRSNLARLGVRAGFRIHAASVGAFLRKPRTGSDSAARFDLVFLDPPYDAAGEYAVSLGLLGGASAGVVADGGLVIAEHRRKERLEDRYGLLERTRLLEQGDASLSFFERRTACVAGMSGLAEGASVEGTRQGEDAWDGRPDGGQGGMKRQGKLGFRRHDWVIAQWTDAGVDARATAGLHPSEHKSLAGDPGLERLWNNSCRTLKRREKRPSGAEARQILLALSARLKSCPDASCHSEGAFPQPVESGALFRRLRNHAVWVLALAAMLFCASGLSAQNAEPWLIGPFTRPAGNPVIAPRPESEFVDPVLKTPAHWEALHTFNPAAVVREGKVEVLYRAEDDSGAMEIGGHTSRLGLAESADGIHFTRRADPVFFPAEDDQQAREWPGGVEDPRIVESEDGTYVLTYTQWNRKIVSVGIATSRDLTHWTKHGPAFLGAAGGKYDGLGYKSAGIVTRLDEKKKRPIADRIGGKYWMYWGEGSIHLATSTDLVHWSPVEDAQGAPVELLRPRAGHFDSSFPETGPPPVATKAGIVVLYNGKNAEDGGDPDLGPDAYAAGEALFDGNDPAKLIGQTDHPVLKPELPYEKTGQYVAGTTFAEGLVYFRHRWFLYYGCADSLVAVAMAPAK